jgi:hypothetical protein
LKCPYTPSYRFSIISSKIPISLFTEIEKNPKNSYSTMKDLGQTKQYKAERTMLAWKYDPVIPAPQEA